MNRSSEIHCAGEIFNTGNRSKDFRDECWENGHEAAMQMLEAIVSVQRGESIIGFAAHNDNIHTIDIRDLVNALVTSNTKVILLEREDRLAQYISFLLASKTRIWDGKDYGDSKVIFREKDYERWKSSVESMTASAVAVIPEENLFRVTYEEICGWFGGNQSKFESLQRWLGVKQVVSAGTPKIPKQAKKPLADYVENREEFEEFVKSQLT